MNMLRVCWLPILLITVYPTFSLSGEAMKDVDKKKWMPISTEFTRVQSGDWIDKDKFVIGRWDGTVSLFRSPIEGEYTPVLLNVVSTSGGAGVEMILARDEGFVLYSDSEDQLALWDSRGQAEPRYFKYKNSLGIANSALLVGDGPDSVLVTGHSNGFLAIWSYTDDQIEFKKQIDVKSDNPIDSPYPLKNVRGLAYWKDNLVVTGSEDGDIAIVDINSGTTIERMRYNESAQRGINNISLVGDTLLLANCSVGKDDDNLWLYDISAGSIKLVDSLNLIKDRSRPQSFNFDADLVNVNGTFQFYASTEEGILWAGKLVDTTLTVDRTAAIASDGGALIDIAGDDGPVLAAARKVFLFGL